MAEPRTFKISELSRIENIDADDLLLISDTDGGVWGTRSMSVGQMVETAALSASQVAGFNEKVGETASRRLSNSKSEWDTDPILSAMVLRDGEVIFGTASDGSVQVKVGDGSTPVSGLAWKNVPGNAVAKTTAEWTSEENKFFQPETGQIVIWLDRGRATITKYTTGEEIEVDVPGIKIGDFGHAYNVDLPFVGQDVEQEMARQLAEHIADEDAHVRAGERDFWNNKINTEDEVVDEVLVLTRN